MTIISAMMMITKYSLPTIDFAILIGTRIFGYIPTRTLLEVKKPTRGCLVMILWTSFMVIVQCVTPDVSTWDHKTRFSISINISIWYVMSFGLYHDLSDHSNHSHQSFHGINANVVIDIVIGHYGYKSSFRANKSIINCSAIRSAFGKGAPYSTVCSASAVLLPAPLCWCLTAAARAEVRRSIKHY